MPTTAKDAPATEPTPDAPAALPALLAAASRQVGAVRKDRTAPGNIGGYQFRGIDAVVNAVHPVLMSLGVVLLPTVLETTRESVPTKNGGTMMNVTVRTRFTFYGPAGDSLALETIGEAADSGDKASTKAQSVALRVALLQALLLPTDEPDPDESNYERAGHGEQAGPGNARPSHLREWDEAFGALTPDQQAWVRKNWPQGTGAPATLNRQGVAQALEWMAANVPPA